MDVESKLGQSLDDLIKSQKTANKKKTGAAKVCFFFLINRSELTKWT